MDIITVEELKARLNDDNLILIDVREPYEHAEFNIGGHNRRQNVLFFIRPETHPARGVL